jgi:hypothetical protein
MKKSRKNCHRFLNKNYRLVNAMALLLCAIIIKMDIKCMIDAFSFKPVRRCLVSGPNYALFIASGKAIRDALWLAADRGLITAVAFRHWSLGIVKPVARSSRC